MGKLYCGCVINDGKRLWCDEHAKAEPVVVLPGATTALEKRVRELEKLPWDLYAAVKRAFVVEKDGRHENVIDPGSQVRIKAAMRAVIEAAIPPAMCAKCGGAEHRCLRGELHECPHPAPSATTAETADTCTCSKNGCAVHDNGPCSECGKSFHDCQCTAEQKTQAWQKWFRENGYAQPAPPSSAGEATLSAQQIEWALKKGALEAEIAFPCGGANVDALEHNYREWMKANPYPAALAQQVEPLPYKREGAGASPARGTIDKCQHAPDCACYAACDHGKLESDLATARAEVERVTRERDAADKHCRKREEELTDDLSDYKQRHRNQVAGNDELWEYFKRIASALGLDGFMLAELPTAIVTLKAERDAATKRADEAEAAAGAYREALQRIIDTDTHGKNVLDGSGRLRPSGTDFCGRCNTNSFHPHADDCPITLARNALAPDIGKAWLRERDELRAKIEELIAVDRKRDQEVKDLLAENRRAVVERDGLAKALRETKHRLVSRAIGDGLSESMAASSAVAIIDRALTPPAPSDSDGEKGGGK